MIHGKPAALYLFPVALLLFLPVSAACGQAGVLPPNPVPVPRVDAPALQTPLSLPSVTAPVLSAPVSPGSPAGTSGQNGAKSPASATSGTSTTTATASGKSVLPDSLDEMSSPISLLNALSGSGADGEGMDALSAFLGGGAGLSALTGSAASDGTSADAATLAKILALLEKQQAETAAAQTAAQKAAPQASNGVAAANVRSASGAEIVRFIINRTDIASTATEVVSSSLAKDGSFLLTGRRPALGELFYLVCKKTGSGTYRLYADLGQDYPNEKSWLYQLVRKTPLDGTLTGDLLVFRTGDPAWALDLVIRVIAPTVPAETVR